MSISTHDRASPAHFLSEAVATLGLIMVIFALARSGRARYTPAAVAAYIGAGYFFTSSTCFANPAITVGRVFSDSFAGIAPSSVPSFVAAQLLGGLSALALIILLYGGMTTAQASDIVVPHDGDASDIVVPHDGDVSDIVVPHDGDVSGAGSPAEHPPGRSGAIS